MNRLRSISLTTISYNNETMLFCSAEQNTNIYCNERCTKTNKAVIILLSKMTCFCYKVRSIFFSHKFDIQIDKHIDPNWALKLVHHQYLLRVISINEPRKHVVRKTDASSYNDLCKGTNISVWHYPNQLCKWKKNTTIGIEYVF